jgi:hypothetical protein
MSEPASLSRWSSFLLECPQEAPFPVVASFYRFSRLYGIHEDRLHGPTSERTWNFSSYRNCFPVSAFDQKPKDGAGGVFLKPVQGSTQSGSATIGRKVETDFETATILAFYQSIHTYHDNVCRTQGWIGIGKKVIVLNNDSL